MPAHSPSRETTNLARETDEARERESVGKGNDGAGERKTASVRYSEEREREDIGRGGS